MLKKYVTLPSSSRSQQNHNCEEQGARTTPLEALFLHELTARTALAYKPWLEQGVVREDEINEEVYRYFIKKKSSIYSYYGEQWAYYHEATLLLHDRFLHFIDSARTLFRRRYHKNELDIDFYLKEMKKVSRNTTRWQLLRKHFLNKWNTLLSEREDHYQKQHIKTLCNDYFRILEEKGNALKNKGRQSRSVSPRLSWLQLTTSPQMRKKIEQLAAVIKREPVIRELTEILGRKKDDEARHYKAIKADNTVRMWKHSSHNDIVGITEGDNLNALMPTEYALMSSSDLENIFYKRFLQKKLSMFLSASHETVKAKASDNRGHELAKNRKKGPYIACIDTSASMHGERELIAKAIILALILKSDEQERPLKVILFSNQIECIEINHAFNDLNRLEEFFCGSFCGGTDLTPAIKHTLETLHTSQFLYADVVWLSDFEMHPLTSYWLNAIQEEKQNGVRFFSIAFGDKIEKSYLELSQKSWFIQS